MTSIAVFLAGMAAAIPLAYLGDYVMSIFANDDSPSPRIVRWDACAIAAACVAMVLVLGAVQQADERAAARVIAKTNGGAK